MDEQVDGSRSSYCPYRNVKEDKKRSSGMSLERNSFQYNKDHSLDHRKSFMQVMGLEGSEKGEEFQEHFGFDERRRSFMRDSHNIENDQIQEQKIEVKRMSSYQKKIYHECSCQGRCNEIHCPCFNEPSEMCLMGECCQNCIIEKNKKMKEDIKKIKLGCLCKNSKCSKSYCKCFQAGRKCDSINCQCEGCENQDQKIDPKKDKPKKKRKQKAQIPEIGCFCKKSYCLKKYCKCFSEGKQCGQHCYCEDCRNRFEEEDDIEEATLQRQRYGRIDSQNDEIDIECYFAGSDYQNQQMPGSMQFQHPNLKEAFDH